MRTAGRSPGLSSGGICSFNAAWQMPDQFSRVISWIGSFTSIQWKEDPSFRMAARTIRRKILRSRSAIFACGCRMAPKIRRMSATEAGRWPIIRMANALKMKGYDFHFSFGKGTHNSGQGAAEFPEEMIWLWRDYDPNKTSADIRDGAVREGQAGVPGVGKQSRRGVRDEVHLEYGVWLF